MMMIILYAGLRGGSSTNGMGEKVVKLQDLFSVFEKLKGSPKFWQTAKNELIAKVKQLGPFHIFYTFSCGEMRWPEVFLSLFKRKGLRVEYPEDWDGSDESILVEGQELWEYVNKMSESRHKLFKDYSFLITRIFDARVKSFVKNVLMGSGKDLPISYYNYRVEFQARGMPHIHGVAWIKKEALEARGITGFLCDHKSAAEDLAKELISCELPESESKSKLRDIVKEVQKHGHTNSCLKKSGSCRFGFPRLPSSETFLTTPLSEEVDEEEKKKLIESASKTLKRAREILDNPDYDKSYEEFLKEIETTEEEYKKLISISQKGRVLILKRDVKERFINNYNDEMLLAWNANMDIQLALDPFAVISYIVNYVSKDETGMTSFLKEALAATSDKDTSEKLKALKTAYLTHRQMGASEAVYRVVPNMRLKDSNITCTFVNSGFPQNRSSFFKKMKDDETLDENEHEEEEVEFEENEVDVDFGLVKLQGRPGKFKQAVSVIDRYSARPQSLKSMCLSQFAISYTYAQKSKLPKSVVFDDDGVSIQKSKESIFNTDEFLPQYIDLSSKNLGVLRLRSFPAILRIHSSKKKEGHEQHYAEMLLFSAWINEAVELPREFDPCIYAYKERIEEIRKNKGMIYPNEEIIDLLDTEDLELQRPTHVYDMLDNQREQENEDDRAIGCIDDPHYESFGYTGNLNHEGAIQSESFKYKHLALPEQDELNFLIQNLVPEQMNIMRKVTKFCKEVIRADAKKDVEIEPDPLRMIIHGGQGVGKSKIINALYLQSEKILRKTAGGAHPNHPRVLVCAFTGKAASLIKGITIHSAFEFKIGNKYETLGPKKRAEMQENLQHLKLLIIDEMSFVGADLLYRMHLRLSEEIFQNKKPFGGISVILVGDLLQLSPIKENYIFQRPNNPHMAAGHEADPLWPQFTPMILKHNHRQGELN